MLSADIVYVKISSCRKLKLSLIDFWPKIPPYVEIEGNSEKTVNSVAKLRNLFFEITKYQSLMAKQKVKPGKYRHFKGMLYNVIGIAKHSETLEELVVYEALYDNPRSKLWVRPLKMFTETVERDGKVMPRFEYVGE